MIYFDNNSTTSISKEVLHEILPFLSEHYGNPSSSHKWGIHNREALEMARDKVANLLGSNANEIYFCSGATEANNTIIKGIAYRHQEKGKHIITSSVEHPSVLRVCDFLERQGFRVTYLPVDRYGKVCPQDLENAISEDSILISIMHANNEVGTIQPILELLQIARDKNIFFHMDVAQSIGKVKIDLDTFPVDALTIAGHKFHAPKGSGAFYIRKEIPFEPLLHGTGHERGQRAGTENLAFSIGLGKACEIVATNMGEYVPKIKEMRDLLWCEIKKNVPSAVRNGHPEECLPNTLNISFPHFIGAQILEKIPELAVSTGAACNKKPGSFVLKAMGVDNTISEGSIRFSLSKYNTMEEVITVSVWIKEAVESLQASQA